MPQQLQSLLKTLKASPVRSENRDALVAWLEETLGPSRTYASKSVETCPSDANGVPAWGEGQGAHIFYPGESALPLDGLQDPPVDYDHESNASRYLALLDSISIPTAVCQEDGTLVSTNIRMDELLAAGDGLHARNGILRCTVPSERDALLEMMRRSATTERDQGIPRTHTMAITRESGKMRLAVIVSPLRSTEFLLRVMVPEYRRVMDAATLAEIFHLTRSEAALTIALIQCGNLLSAAKLCALTIGSARQYLKRIFIKTGTSGQVELVSLILQLPPL